MAYRLVITTNAEGNLRWMPVRKQRIIESGIESHLVQQPQRLSKSIKLLRPNPFAQYELRIEELRVLYNVDNEKQEVTILLAGEKVGNTLNVEGREFREHQSDTAEQTGE